MTSSDPAANGRGRGAPLRASRGSPPSSSSISRSDPSSSPEEYTSNKHKVQNNNSVSSSSSSLTLHGIKTPCNVAKKTRKSLILEVKLDIIHRHERAEKTNSIASHHGLTPFSSQQTLLRRLKTTRPSPSEQELMEGVGLRWTRDTTQFTLANTSSVVNHLQNCPSGLSSSVSIMLS
ncbi:hypothetical protein E2C01_002402 [Portunus trituberculatus]|uniref:HTH psq-type domain-containing protein n=1 Tax=Portunus trituberculatus TaxID=210409 RepID=A0A5B7CM64_PORTR|nr:hypothetical protein [Portunus trituberculatus]